MRIDIVENPYYNEGGYRLIRRASIDAFRGSCVDL